MKTPEQHIDWHHIDTILLDMDGTLLDLHFDSHFWLEHLPSVVAQQQAISLAQARDFLAPIFAQHARTLNWYCVHFWSQQVGFDILQHKQQVAHHIGYRPNAQNFLAHCRAHSQDLRLITNGHRKVLDLKIEHTHIDQYFDQMHCSHELGYPKENINFWHALHKHQAFDPATTLFVDDSEYVLDVAAEYGIKHIYSIAEPDSNRPRTEQSKFPMLEDLASTVSVSD